MMGELREEVIGETLDAPIGKILDTDVAANRLLKKLLTSRSFMRPIATFIRHNTDSAIAVQNTVLAKASKKKPVTDTKHITILWKHHQAGRTQPARNAAQQVLLTLTIVMWSVMTGKLNDSLNRQNRQRKSTTCSENWNRMTSCFQCISDMTATVKHGPRRWRMIHQVSVMGKPATIERKFYRSSALSMIGEPLDYRTCGLADESSSSDSEVARSVSKWTDRLQAQMKLQTFD